MPARWVVPSFDELEACDAGFSLCLELPTIQQFAFERCEEALAHGVVIAIANRSHRWTNTHFFAAQAEGHGCVLRSLVAMMNDAIRFALRDSHVHRVDDQLRFLIIALGPRCYPEGICLRR